MTKYDANVMCVALAGLQAAIHSLKIQVGAGLADPEQLAIAVGGIEETLEQMPDLQMRAGYTQKISPLFAELERMAAITWEASQNG